MKKKKRVCFLGVLIVLIGMAIFLIAYKKTPVLEYPLKKEDIANAMKDCEFPKTLEIEQNDVMAFSDWQTTSFSIRNYESELYAGHCFGILSNKKDDVRSVSLNVSTIDEEEALSQEELKQAILLATHLFGGFQNDKQVYKALLKDVDVSTDFEWKKEIRGNTCHIQYRSEGQMKLTIAITNDWDAFYHYEE